MSNRPSEDSPSFALDGWRDRSTGTMHLEACPDFEALRAELIEDVVWLPDSRYERLCPACFPAATERKSAVSKRIEPYGY
jgi:hypothetical protein